MQPTNLFEYYKSQGKKLPSLEERRLIAQEAGISDYAGTASQNSQLLSFLSGSGSSSPLINTDGQINLNNVSDITPVPIPQIQPTTAEKVSPAQFVSVVGETQNPDGSYTVSYSDGVKDNRRYVKNADGSYSSIPANESPEDSLLRNKASLESEIDTLTKKIYGSNNSRNASLEGAGVFEDMRTLTNLKNQLGELSDRELAIPLEARQALRGRGATKTEFTQTTTPDLERNALATLTASRRAESLSNVINTNTNIINSAFDAQEKADLFLFTQKKDQLAKIESAYSSIMTAKQAELLEQRKFENDVALLDAKMFSELKKTAIESLPKSLFADPNFSASVANMSLDQIYGLTGLYGGTASFSQLTPEQAAMTLTPQQFGQYESYKKMTAEQKKVLDTETAQANQAANIADMVQKLLNDTEGLSNSVGFGLGKKDLSFFGLGNETDQFRAQAVQLMRVMGNQALADLRASGVTPGSVTESEWKRFDQIGSLLGQWSVDADGNPSGKFKVKEETFKNALKDMQDSSMKLYLIKNLGEEAYGAQNIANLSYDSVVDMYNDLKTNQQNSVLYQQKQSLTPNQTSFGNVSADPNKFGEAIAIQESGKNYNAVGPTVKTGMYAGQQALGKYQIMPGNIGPWSKEVLGYEITPQQFKSSPELQDALAIGKFQQLLAKHSPADAAAIWFSGRPLSGNSSSDVTGTNVPTYVRNVLNNLASLS